MLGHVLKSAVFDSFQGDLAKVQLSRPVCTEVGEKIALSRRVDKHWRLIGSLSLFRSLFGCALAHRHITGWGRINTGKRMAINTAPITATAAAFKSSLHNDGLDVEDEDEPKSAEKAEETKGDE